MAKDYRFVPCHACIALLHYASFSSLAYLDRDLQNNQS